MFTVRVISGFALSAILCTSVSALADTTTDPNTSAPKTEQSQSDTANSSATPSETKPALSTPVTSTAQATPQTSLALPGLRSPVASPLADRQTQAIAPSMRTVPTRERDVLADAAVAYGSYHGDVTVYNRSLNSKDDVDAALDALGSHNTDRLASGWLAYSALLASQSPEFAKAVRDVEAHYGSDRMMLGLRNSASYALSLDGSDDAMRRAIGASKADARRLESAGERIKDQAYSMQSMGWAKAKLGGARGSRAAELRETALTGRPLSGQVRTLFAAPRVDEAISQANMLGAGSSLWDRVSSVGPELKLPGLATIRPASTYQPRYAIRSDRRETAGRIATLAAYRVMGQTETRTGDISKALSDPMTKDCLEMAQMQLLQCVSATYRVYERPFCIGEHALKDIGACVGEVAH